MGTTTVKLTRTIVQTKEVEVELKGNDESEIDDALDTHIEEKSSLYENIEDMNWDLDSCEITDQEVLEYPEFDEEE